MIEAVRAMPALAETPILMVSASSFEGHDQAKALNQSDGFLAKPIDINRLLGLIGEQLDLVWLYEETESQLDTDHSATMVVPPIENLTELHHLAQRGNIKKIKQWSEQIVKMDEQYRPFVERVNTLAKVYDGQAIEKLVAHYLDE